MSSPTKPDDNLPGQKSSSVSCSENVVSQNTENPASTPSSDHISISTKTLPIPVSILSGNPKGQGSVVEIVQNSDKAPTVILTPTPPSGPSFKTKFVQQTSPRIGPMSPAEPPGGLFLKDLSLSNQNTKLDGLKAWKTDRRKATPYPQPEAEEYEFDDTPEDISTEDAEDDQ